jgi:AcrR family transcriptional regulator
VTPRKRPLTRDEILTAALAIVDEAGPDALSMRKLAAALGVEAMTLYHHFANKDAILDGVVERVFGEMHVPDPLPGEWMALAEEMFAAFRQVLVDHPNTIALLARRPLNTRGSADFVEAPLAVLSRSGLPPDRVGKLYQSLVAYSFGHAFIASDRPVAPEDAPIRRDDGRYPVARAAGASVTRFDEETFREVLGHIMRGFVR